MNALLDPTTRHNIESYIADPSHALLMIGPEGTGKKYLLYLLTADLLKLSNTDGLNQNPQVHVIDAETSIGIESIRHLRQFVKLKSADASGRRVILIPDAHRMTQEAQNALLKLLEEPPRNVYFLMSSASENGLEQTVRSRCHTIRTGTADLSSTIAHFVALGFTQEATERAYLMAGGRIGLVTVLLDGDEQNSLHQAYDLAKKIISANKYDRLILVDEIIKTKQSLDELMFALKRLLRLTLARTTSVDGHKRLHGALTLVNQCEAAITSSNPNSKLLLTHLFVEL